MNRTELISIINEDKPFDFEYFALQLFKYQYKFNAVYSKWVDDLNCKVDEVRSVQDIPFLPISAFKSSKLYCEKTKEELIFTSSGTTGSAVSKHYVFDLKLYLKNAQSIFESFYGEVESYCFLALLPSYLERSGSSLVQMVEHFIGQSNFSQSGFYLYDHDKLKNQLLDCQKDKIPTILFGVSFALLDFIKEHKVSFPELIIIETGGMKGRKNEITREELHSTIAKGFNVEEVHSEYGMTELFSQAYSKRGGVYQSARTMSVLIKDISDPLQSAGNKKTGIINIIDLANVDSCAFIETQDLGKKYADGSFEVLGRLDVSDIRGCNLMVSDM